LKQKYFALLVGMATSVGAYAEIDLALSSSGGNSSVLFVAIATDNNIALTVDLGLNMADFTSSTTFSSGLTAPVAWNFATNSTNSRATGNSWSTAYNDFKARQGGNIQWAVIAADLVLSSVVSPSNVIPGRGWLSTGNVSQDQMLRAVSPLATTNGAAAFHAFSSSVRNLGNLIEANNGAATSTRADGQAHLGISIGDNFNRNQTWSYLINNGETSTFQWQFFGGLGATSNPFVRQFGLETTTDSLSSTPLLVTFDIKTDSLCFGCARSVSVPPIPEPGSAALLAAGLTALAWRSRRRFSKVKDPSLR
jgi:PEP-CTERM motif